MNRILLIGALFLASCSPPKPLKTNEQASIEEAIAVIEEVPQTQMAIRIYIDPETSCQYLITTSGAISPRYYKRGQGLTVPVSIRGCE